MYVAFRHSDRRIFARFVCAIRGGDSAHVEAALPLLGPLHQCVSSSFIDGGARGKVIDITDPSKWRVYKIDDDYHLDPIEWLRKNYKVKYDLLGLVVSTIPVVRDNPNKKICSESVAEMIPTLIGDPRIYDLVRLEAELAYFCKRVEWKDGAWVAV